MEMITNRYSFRKCLLDMLNKFYEGGYITLDEYSNLIDKINMMSPSALFVDVMTNVEGREVRYYGYSPDVKKTACIQMFGPQHEPDFMVKYDPHNNKLWVDEASYLNSTQLDKYIGDK